MLDSQQNTDSDQSFAAAIKSATADVHQALESLDVTSALMSPQLTMDAYRNYLQLMFDVIYDVEKHFFPRANSIYSDLTFRMKTQLLSDDFCSLDGKPISPRPVFDTAIDSPAFIAGIIYVVEGSTLGGRYILKNVESVLGLSATNGASFLAGYGNHTGSYWKNFLKDLTAYEKEHAAGQEIIDGALYAFGAIHKHFAKSSLNVV
ncbi:MAG: biliverdin-producing heme oxygenase [Flavobacterium sp.]|nr:biliverdin-producing heme oxygenase [Flavobacterium sp.]